MQPPFVIRKQRTRQHVIADQSINFVERFVIAEGHAVQRMAVDYGYDMVLMTFDDQGYLEPGILFLQVKASDRFVRSGENYAYDLDIRDYNLWKTERVPVILILFDAKIQRAFWVHVQDYFAGHQHRQPRRGAKTVRIILGPRQSINRRAVSKLRAIKNHYAMHIVGGT